MRRVLIGLTAVLLAVVASPAFSQVDFLFPHGFAVGDVTATTAVLWTRREPPLEVTVEVSPDRRFEILVYTSTATPTAERGGMVKVVATGLMPATRYHYRFLVGGVVYSEIGTFVTAPPVEAREDVRLAFSGDADGTHVDGAPAHSFALLDAVAAERPDVFIVIGDTIYADSRLANRPARTLAEYRAKHLETRSIPAVQRLLRATSVMVIWDDHEVQNDFDRETVDPARFAAGHQAFVEAWPITEQAESRLYRSFRRGKEVEVFVLDLRSYRSRQASKTPACANPPGSRTPDIAPTLPRPLRAALAPVVRQLALPVPADCLQALGDPNRTLLGTAQKSWLKEGLARSDATWKFIVSEVPVQEFFGLPYDRWEGYPAERAEILGFIRASNIKNVVWFSSDTHAVLINDVRLSTFTPPFETTGMKEVVAGPIATTPFGLEIEEVLGPLAPPAFAAFALTPLPQGLGMSCAVLDRFTYALVEVSSSARTVTITPKDAAGRPVCRTPLVITAQ